MDAAGNWFSPSGLNEIRWVPGQASTFTAVPPGTFASSGYGTSACCIQPQEPQKLLKVLQKVRQSQLPVAKRNEINN